MNRSGCACILWIVLGGTFTLCSGCASDLSTRVSTLEQRLDAVGLEHQLLPQQMETFRIKLDALDQEVRTRQSRIVAELGHFRGEDLVHLTQRIDALTENFQRFRREITADAVGRLGTDVIELQDEVGELKRGVEKLQVQHDQAFAAETAWLAALAWQLESARSRLPKSSGAKRAAAPSP